MRYRLFVSIVFCMLVSSIVYGQNSASIYSKANEMFELGEFEKADSFLLHNIGKINSEYRVAAYRLLSVSALQQDRQEMAKKYAHQLLQENPSYTIQMNEFPKFADLIKQLKEGAELTITTASQQAESLEEAPVPVTLITEDMLKSIGARTLKDALVTFVPGMTDIASNDEMNVAMRGIYSSSQEKILIMLNGHRLNSYSTNTATPDFSMSLEKVKQIEVLRGPASSIYGGVALTAVVNIITKSGKDIDGLLVKAAGGNYGQVRGDLLFGKRFLGLDVMVWGSIYNATGEKHYSDASEQKYALLPNSGDIIIGAYNKQPTYDIGVNLTYKQFGLLYNRSQSKTVSPLATSAGFAPYSYDKYGTLNGNKPGNYVSAQNIELSYQDQKGRFSWMAKAFYYSQNQQRYQITGDTLPDLGGMTTIVPNGTNDSVRMAMGGFQAVSWNERTFGIKLQGAYEYRINKTHSGVILLGGEFDNFSLYDASYLEGIYYDMIIKTYYDEKVLYKGNESSADVFAQIKHKWGERFYINAGVRYDFKRRRTGNKMHEVSPRVAFIYNMPKLNFKLSYSRAFVDAPYYYRSNTLDLQTGYDDLEPEIMHSVQFSVLSDRKLFKFLTLEANLCFNHADDFIVTEEAVSFNWNAGSASTLSFEFISRFNFKKFMGEFNCTYLNVLKTEYCEVDNHIFFNVPHFQTNLIAAYKILPNLSVRANANIVTAQTARYVPVLEGEFEYIDVPARCIVNAGVSYNIKRLGLFVDVHNLFNTHYSQGGSTVAPIRQKGLWVMGGASYKF